MKILVTGGAGFCGSHLSNRLIKKGHDVVTLGRGNDAKTNADARFVKHDILNDFSGLFQKESFDAVYHLAAQNAVWRSLNEPLYDCRVNIEGSLNIIEECRKNGVKIIYTSSAGTLYGNTNKLPVSEDDPVNPISPYGISKYTVEKYLFMYGEVHGLSYTVLRYPSVYGPGQVSKRGANIVSILVDKILNGKKITVYGDGTQSRDFVYIADIVDATELALSKGDRRTYNLASGKAVSILELIDLISKISEKKPDVEFKPRRAGEINKIYFDTRRAKEELNWQATTPIEEGLRRMIYEFKTV